MATIKLYTDSEQSKKLAEILPLESADMCYVWSYGRKCYTPELFSFIQNQDNEGVEHIDYPCWSLVALLEVLKNKIVYGGNDSKSWFVSYTKKNPTKTIFIYKERLIDACYEAILNLNKEGLL